MSCPNLFAFRISTDAAPRRVLLSSAVVAAFLLAGALPVLTIVAHVLGVARLHDAAVVLVLPSAAIALTLSGTRESVWAAHGLIAGLLATAAYDVLRIPSALARIWPDFIPRLGGWIMESPGESILLGYLWRYLGDGGGIGLVFFMLCGILGIHRGTRLGRIPVLLGIGYGILVWSGLMATILLSSDGPSLLFCISPPCVMLSLFGHLIFGSVLGLCYGAFLDGRLNIKNIMKRLLRTRMTARDSA